jgi:hypothetical protein
MTISPTGSCTIDAVLLIRYHTWWEFFAVCKLSEHYSHSKRFSF